jgi:hypothetical protein
MSLRVIRALGWIAIAHGLSHAVPPLRGSMTPAYAVDDWTPLARRLRTRPPRTWAAALGFMPFELPHFIMERRMILAIKALAEDGARAVARSR